MNRRVVWEVKKGLATGRAQHASRPRSTPLVRGKTAPKTGKLERPVSPWWRTELWCFREEAKATKELRERGCQRTKGSYA